MAQIGEPQRVIISEPLYEPVPGRETEPVMPEREPVQEPQEVPV